MTEGVLKALKKIIFAAAMVAALCAPALAMEVWTTSPWLSMMARFIGGVHIKVNPMKVWTPEGAVVNAKRPPNGATVIGIDDMDVASLAASRYKTRTLYSYLPSGGANQELFFFDPATLPFLSQRLLIVISSIDSANYPYYQRRLAEFQSRMESTLEVGRKLLGKTGILDLSGLCGPWVRAACTGAVRPPAELWGRWRAGQDLATLTASIQQASERKWLILVDPWSEHFVLSAVVGRKNVVRMPVPVMDGEMFSFFYDTYLTIWNHMRVTSK